MKSLIVALVLGLSSAAMSQPVALVFKEGEHTRVNIREVLKLTLFQPQVEDEFVQPSVRNFDYSWTERVEKVNDDGTALIAITLDSFQTTTFIGEGKGAEEYFRFNSTDEYDLRKNFRDIKTYPRGQFLGQTLRFTIGPDGLIRSFENLDGYKVAAQGKGFDYEMVRAILALADERRLGQLLEQGFGAIAALNRKDVTTPFTMTEVPVDRELESRKKGDTLVVKARYTNPPQRIEYLEGIAIPIVLTNFGGEGSGKAVVKKGKFVWGSYQDSAMVTLNIDPEVIPYKAVREVTVRRSPIDVIRNAKVTIRETEQHTAKPKDPELVVPEGAKEIELPGATVEDELDRTN